MSYTALYRKYRPAEFDEVKGQEHIVTTLKNQIRAQRIGHAYLFCGTRGTGKTTIARIFAKAINCENPVDGSPCGVCPMCRAIAEERSMNVIEIDGASNNGVDNIRLIRDEVSYPPTEGRYKVYIIDEAHMISPTAFNAFLKTLEEPPSYVVFIMATTDPQKIPVTILSRCQRYDFHRISIDTISGRLTDLVRQEQIEAEEKAIRYIAKVADGSMRDALSLLEQCISFYLGETLTYERVLDVLGAVDTAVFSRLLRAVLDGNVTASIRVLEDLVIQGRELGKFVNDFFWYLRNLLLVKGSDQMEDVLDMSADNLALLKEEAEMAENEVIMRYIRVFSELSAQLKYAPQKRVLTEVALIKLCRPAMETSNDALVNRIVLLEKQIENGAVFHGGSGGATDNVSNERPQANPGGATAVSSNGTSGGAVTTPTRPEISKAIPDDIRKVVKNWRLLTQKVPVLMRMYLKQARLSLGGENKLMLVFDDEMAYTYIADEAHRQEIQNVISRQIGKEIELLVQKNETNRPFEETFVDLEKIIHMKIDVEDD